MIPKTLLLAFLSLQGSREPQTPERGSPLSNIAHLDVVNELTATLQDARAGIDEAISEIEFSTGPSVQKSSNDQVSFAIPFEEEMVAEHEIKEIIFTSVKLPDTYPDGFKFNEEFQQIHELKYAYPLVPHPPATRGAPLGDIKFVWGLGNNSSDHGKVHFSFGDPVQDVRVQFGLIENDKLKGGSYTIWAAGTHDPIPEAHSNNFPAGQWAETSSIIKPAKSFLLDVNPTIVDGVLVISRILYRHA